MNKNAIFVAAVAACLSSGAALAQSDGHRGDRGDRGDRSERYQQQQPQQQNYNRNDSARQAPEARGYSRDRQYGDRGYRADHRGDQRDYRRHDGYSRHDGRGAGPRYDMRRGGYVSQEYRGNRYVVRDWSRHRGMYAPQRGHQWVQAGNDYLLVAIATGVIAQVLLN